MKKICIFGGGSLYRLPIYKLMAEKIGCEFYVVEDDPSMGIKTYDYNLLPTYKGSLYQKKLIGNFFWLKGAVSLFWKDYDIYVLGGPFCLSYWVMIILSWFSKKKVMSWSHGMYGKEKGMRKWIKTIYYNLNSMNFVYNERAIEIMANCGIRRNKITFVGNSLDTNEDLKIRAFLRESNDLKQYFSNDNPILIFVGRVTNVKRLDLVIESMSILKKRGIPINFFVVGKDVDGVNLKEIAKSKGLDDNVYLYGPCYDGALLGNFYYNADLCVSPGNVGLTAISSMSFGCPVISHNNLSMQMPEFEAIREGKTGSFFKENDATDLADKIQIWLNGMDAEKRQLVRQNAFNEIDTKWNIYSEEKAFEEAFNKL